MNYLTICHLSYIAKVINKIKRQLLYITGKLLVFLVSKVFMQTYKKKMKSPIKLGKEYDKQFSEEKFQRIKNIKEHSTSLVTRELHVKAIMKILLLPI